MRLPTLGSRKRFRDAVVETLEPRLRRYDPAVGLMAMGVKRDWGPTMCPDDLRPGRSLFLASSHSNKLKRVVAASTSDDSTSSDGTRTPPNPSGWHTCVGRRRSQHIPTDSSRS